MWVTAGAYHDHDGILLGPVLARMDLDKLDALDVIHQHADNTVVDMPDGQLEDVPTVPEDEYMVGLGEDRRANIRALHMHDVEFGPASLDGLHWPVFWVRQGGRWIFQDSGSAGQD